MKLERTSPGFLAGERLRKVLFGAHPYAQISPSEAQVAAYKREDLQSVYSQIYTPENGLLMMVGDFDPQAMLKTSKKCSALAGKKPRKELPAPAIPRASRLPGSQSRLRANANPCRLPRHHPEASRLDQAGIDEQSVWRRLQFAAGDEYSRGQRLYVQPAQQRESMRQHGYFSVSAAVRNEVVAASLTEIFYEIDKLRSLPVPEAELADAQNYLTGVFSMGLATQEGLLSQFPRWT